MQKLLLALALGAFLAAPVRAQTVPELMRLEWIGGVLLQGEMATSELFTDFSFFDGPQVRRSGGSLDVDPSVFTGLQATYRLNQQFSLGASWVHSRGRYRVQYPALASDPGDFDLEGFLLSSEDFVAEFLGTSRAERAMGDAVTDMYLASATFEVPRLERWLFPYVTVGAGLFKQKSDDSVFDLEYEGDPPPGVLFEDLTGIPYEEQVGVPFFRLNETDFLAQVGGGFRISLGKKWGLDVRAEDFIRFASMGGLDESTPPPEGGTRFFSVSLKGKDGAIHNVGFRLSVNYAIWPYSQPR